MNRYITLIMHFLGFLLISVVLEAQDIWGEKSHMYRTGFQGLINSFESSGRLKWQKPDEVIALFGDLSGKTVIDIGTGTGYFVFRLAEKAKKVIAADVDNRFLELLKYRLDTMTDLSIKSKIEPRKIPYGTPGLQPEEVDAVLLVNTYHHIEGRISYLKELRNGIKQGGRILIVDFYKDSEFGPPRDHKIGMEVVVSELKGAGFQFIDADTNTLKQQYIVIVDVK